MFGICCKIPSLPGWLRHAGAGLFLLCAFCIHAAFANTLSGDVTDPDGHAVSGATVQLLWQADSSQTETKTDGNGRFFFANLEPGGYRLIAEYRGFAPVTGSIALSDDNQTRDIHFIRVASQSASVIVSGDVNELDILNPDPAERVFVSQDLLDANPGPARRARLHSGIPD
jgi:hypothetical protein